MGGFGVIVSVWTVGGGWFVDFVAGWNGASSVLSSPSSVLSAVEITLG